MVGIGANNAKGSKTETHRISDLETLNKYFERDETQWVEQRGIRFQLKRNRRKLSRVFSGTK